MGNINLPTVTEMTDIHNAIIALIVIMIGGFGALFTANISQWKIYIPRIFKQRDEKREAELTSLKAELENKAASEAVDIERERMLPELIKSTIEMSKSFNITMLQNIQQTATYTAQLNAHDRQLSANTDRLEELAQMVETQITNIQLLKDEVTANTDHSKAAAAFGNQAATSAQETLEFVKSEIRRIVVEQKHDTGEVKPVNPPAEVKADSEDKAA